MGNSFVFSIWLGAILYVVVGLLGAVVSHGAGPGTRALTDGYGVAYNATAASQNGNGRILTR